MKNQIEIGSAPSDEACAQIGDPNFDQQNRRECRAFLDQIRRVFGEPPDGCQLKIVSNRHEYGVYREVAVVFDERNEASIEWAFRVDEEAPRTWDMTARRYLALAELTEDGD